MTKNNQISKAASAFGKLGGKKSVESRFKGKSESEISEIMKRVRAMRASMTPEMKKIEDDMTAEFVKGLNENVKKSK